MIHKSLFVLLILTCACTHTFAQTLANCAGAGRNYNPQFDKCIGSRVIGKDLELCDLGKVGGSAVFDPKFDKCVGSRVIGRDLELCDLGKVGGSAVFDPKFDKCVGSRVIGRNLELCDLGKVGGSAVFNPKFDKCIGSRVIGKDLELCDLGKVGGSAVFNPKFDKCVNETVFRKELELCQSEGVPSRSWIAYDPKVEQCVQGKTYALYMSPCVNSATGSVTMYDTRQDKCRFAPSTTAGSQYIKPSNIETNTTTFGIAQTGVQTKLPPLELATLLAESIPNYCNKRYSGKYTERHRPRGSLAADCTNGLPITNETIIKGGKVLEKFRKIDVIIDSFPVVRVFDPARRKDQHLIFIVTDGTGNAGEQFIPEKSTRYTPDSCIGVVQTTAPSFNQKFVKLPSNPRVLYNQVSISGAENIHTVYIRGVGTEPNEHPTNPTISQDANVISSAQGGEDLSRQIKEAMRLTKETVVNIRAKNPEASFVFITAGFSRGAAAARVVNNKLTKYFSQDPIFNKSAPVIGATILFDTVVTVSPPSFYENNQLSDFDLRLDLSIPNSVVQGIHIVAENEYRETFPSTPVEGASRVSYDTSTPVILSGSLKRFLEVPVPGAHSDIGGTYSPDGISAFTLQIAVRYLEKLGVRLAPLHPIYLPNPSNYAIHDSQYCPLEPFSKVIERAREEKRY